jgi:hypothetical protein
MAAINRNTVRDLRPVLEKALNDVLTKAGLDATAQLGRITFVPGQEFRCKLTVNQVRKNVAKSRPKVGEYWIVNGKRYRVEADNGHYFLISRHSRARTARYVMGRGMVADYKISAVAIELQGVPA